MSDAPDPPADDGVNATDSEQPEAEEQESPPSEPPEVDEQGSNAADPTEAAVTDEATNARPEGDGMSREEELQEWEQTLDERERGLRQIRGELDEREAELEDQEQELREQRQQLQSKRGDLNEWESQLEERAVELDEREAAIESQEESLAERAEELDEHERILEQYVDDRVGQSLDGRIERIEKVVGDRIAALEEEVGETVRTEVSDAFGDQEKTSPLGIAVGAILGIAGAGLVAAGVIFGFAGDISSVPMLHSDTTINTAASAIIALAGLTITLIGVTGRLVG